MSIKKSIETVEIKKEIISSVSCDYCSRNVGHVSIMKENEMSTYQTLDVSSHLDGFNINVTAGYGTEHDSRKMSITLCSDCLFTMMKQFGGIVK